MLRQMNEGAPVHSCMAGLGISNHGHAHDQPNALDELISTPEGLTFEFTLMVDFSLEETYYQMVIIISGCGKE